MAGESERDKIDERTRAIVPDIHPFYIAYVIWNSPVKDTPYRDKGIVIAGTSTTSRITTYLAALGAPCYIVQGSTEE